MQEVDDHKSNLARDTARVWARQLLLDGGLSPDAAAAEIERALRSLLTVDAQAASRIAAAAVTTPAPAWPPVTPGAHVIDLTGEDAPELLQWIAAATGKSGALERGEMTLTAGAQPGTRLDDAGDLLRVTAAMELARVVGRRARRKGGRAPKRLPGIWQHVRELVTAKPKITAKEAWESFPKAEHRVEVEGLIYRDGNELVEVEDRTGAVRKITYDSFRRYPTDARKELRSK